MAKVADANRLTWWLAGLNRLIFLPLHAAGGTSTVKLGGLAKSSSAKRMANMQASWEWPWAWRASARANRTWGMELLVAIRTRASAGEENGNA